MWGGGGVRFYIFNYIINFVNFNLMFLGLLRKLGVNFIII